MKTKMFFYVAAIAALFMVGTMTSCHKDKPTPPAINPLTLINGHIGSVTTITVDYSKSVNMIADQGFLEDYSNVHYPIGGSGTATISCSVVSFDRAIPTDTVQLWFAYKKLRAAKSQELAVYGTKVYASGIEPTAKTLDSALVALGDNVSSSGTTVYLAFGDSNGDYAWDVYDIPAAKVVSTKTTYLAVNQ